MKSNLQAYGSAADELSARLHYVRNNVSQSLYIGLPTVNLVLTMTVIILAS